MERRIETPNFVTVRFAKGVTLEHEEGVGIVNWCAFVEETNKQQRTQHTLDRTKLEELREKIGESRGVEGKKKLTCGEKNGVGSR